MSGTGRSAELAGEFEKLGPWVFQFRIAGADYGGTISAIGDVRLAQFLHFAPEAERILELGALEGAHSVLLAAERHVKQVVAIEGRGPNIRKAELVKRLLSAGNVEFVEANLEATDLTNLGRFDAVFCSGLLYHLPEPWELIEQLPRVAPKLFIWTHYADDLQADVIQHELRGQVHREGGADEPLSGMSPTAFWPTLGSLTKLLTTSGYRTVHVINNDMRHKNSPAVTIAADVADYAPAARRKFGIFSRAQ
ncbi:MAG TPA: class I SAM-dependent methyltransferase [Chthoniobacterales bacterium]|nr:class I SAM-dependent methyltransferase [Chthoniobacterales bacterium]